jgi:hypothetical protein
MKPDASVWVAYRDLLPTRGEVAPAFELDGWWDFCALCFLPGNRGDGALHLPRGLDYVADVKAIGSRLFDCMMEPLKYELRKAGIKWVFFLEAEIASGREPIELQLGVDELSEASLPDTLLSWIVTPMGFGWAIHYDEERAIYHLAGPRKLMLRAVDNAVDYWLRVKRQGRRLE